MQELNVGQLHVGLIGAGRIGRVHAGNLAYRIPEASLVAVSDIGTLHWPIGPADDTTNSDNCHCQRIRRPKPQNPLEVGKLVMIRAIRGKMENV